MPLLHIENFAPRPSSGPFALTLEAGEQVALVEARGESLGSALLRALALLQRPHAGRILFEQHELTRLPDSKLRALRRHFQYVGGHPARILAPHFTVQEALREPLLIHRLGSAAEQSETMARAAARLGLHRGLLQRNVLTLSAALRMRAALARAWTLQPRLLIGDALAEHLEPAAGAQLLSDLARLCRAEGRAWLWTTPDSALARRLADRVLRLANDALIPVP